MLSRSISLGCSKYVVQVSDAAKVSLICRESEGLLRQSRSGFSSSAAPIPAVIEEPGEELNKRRILDYTKYISKKSLLREPSITRTLSE